MTTTQLSDEMIAKLEELGIIGSEVRDSNVGDSDYAEHVIQPWSIWQDWKLDPWDADIVKRVLRTKKSQSRIEDYEKIIHICKEKIRQLNSSYNGREEIFND